LQISCLLQFWSIVSIYFYFTLTTKFNNALGGWWLLQSNWCLFCYNKVMGISDFLKCDKQQNENEKPNFLIWYASSWIIIEHSYYDQKFFGLKRKFYSAEYWMFLCSIKASPNINTTHPRSDNFISFHETVGILQSKLFSILGRIFIFLLSPGHTPQKKTNSPCLKCAIITCLRFNLAFMAWGVHQVSSIFYEQCLWTHTKVRQIANLKKNTRG
jgi:hypothetical protein